MSNNKDAPEESTKTTANDQSTPKGNPTEANGANDTTKADDQSTQGDSKTLVTKGQKLSANRTTRASVFEDFFSDSQNLLQLFHAIHPEETNVTIEDLKNITIKNVVAFGLLHNDLGFTVGNRLLILIESQTLWSPNIVYRLLGYLVDEWRKCIAETQQDIYGAKPLELPVPELYVIYTGTKQVPEDLYLKNVHFGGKQVDVEVHVTVLTEESDTVLGQYITFCQVYRKQLKLYPDDAMMAIDETIRICKERNVLASYLSHRETEVVNMMRELFDQEVVNRNSMRALEKEVTERVTEKVTHDKDVATAKELFNIGLLSFDQIASVASSLSTEELLEIQQQV